MTTLRVLTVDDSRTILAMLHHTLSNAGFEVLQAEDGKQGLDVLKTEGFIRGYAAVEHPNGRKELEIELKYFDGEPVIREISRVSKPGRRVYASVKALPRVNNGLGVAILSTPKGVMADHDARDNNVGGEVLCTVF